VGAELGVEPDVLAVLDEERAGAERLEVERGIHLVRAAQEVRDAGLRGEADRAERAQPAQRGHRLQHVAERARVQHEGAAALARPAAASAGHARTW
jgi:hypothetical protein